ncbi:HlyD family type I secretion periplasmic adaptor subunit [Marimonas sp. MJW-29]|uniref:Membrane fusion protein (MFP) family protein n=1 Tax=Sulfitobacter sediminis TaxID=3234186 RepID=A0ABV3RH25_9RHOB
MAERTMELATARPFVLLGTMALAVMLLGIAMWGGTTVISGAILAPGVIEARESRQIVQHPTGGKVAEVLVREGDAVMAGDPLIRLDTEAARAELAYVEEQLFEIRARLERLRAEYTGSSEVRFGRALEEDAATQAQLAAILDGQRALFRAGRETLREQTSQLRQRQRQGQARIEGIEAQIAALAVQRQLIESALSSQQDLKARGLVPAATVLQFQREESVLQGQMGELIASRAQAREQIAEIEIEITQRASLYRQEAIARARELEQPLRDHRAEARRLEAEIAAAELRAPVQGVVFGLAVTVGQAVVRPAEPLLYVVPQGGGGLAVLRVPPRDIDQVVMGQEVKLRLSALDQRITPEITGHVSQLSADRVLDDRTQEDHYRVEVSLPRAELSRLPEGVLLLPGMPVEAFIKTQERTPMAFLVKPIADYFARALRES